MYLDKCTWIYLDILGYTWIYLDMLGYTWIYLDILGYTWIYLDILVFADVRNIIPKFESSSIIKT